MKIEFISPVRLVNISKEPKINLLTTKKLSFNKGAKIKYGVTRDSYFRIGFNKDEPNDKSIYLLKSIKEDDKARKVQKAGEQLVLPVHSALKLLEIDNKNIRFRTETEDLIIDGEEYIRVKFLKMTEN